MSAMLSLKPLRLKHINSILDFFDVIKNNKWFQPHKWDVVSIWKMIKVFDNKMADFYCGLFINDKIIGYGFLRGWKEEWDDICLGLIIHPDYREMKFGTLLLNFLIQEARIRELHKIRLHVNVDNRAAMQLYQNAGFGFTGERRDNGELIGYKCL